jgi:hypothetical protein
MDTETVDPDLVERAFFWLVAVDRNLCIHVNPTPAINAYICNIISKFMGLFHPILSIFL